MKTITQDLAKTRDTETAVLTVSQTVFDRLLTELMTFVSEQPSALQQETLDSLLHEDEDGVWWLRVFANGWARAGSDVVTVPKIDFL